MNRRSFLRFLGMAPIVAPVVAAGAQMPDAVPVHGIAGEFVVRPSVSGHVLGVSTVLEDCESGIRRVAGHGLEAIEAIRDGGVMAKHLCAECGRELTRRLE